MMRLLVDVMQVAWDEAWDLTTKCRSVRFSGRGGPGGGWGLGAGMGDGDGDGFLDFSSDFYAFDDD